MVNFTIIYHLSLSWGILPVFAGAAIQSNSISVETVIFSVIAGFASYVLITTSRKYKHLKDKMKIMKTYYKKEIILKIVSSVVIFGTILFFMLRYL